MKTTTTSKTAKLHQVPERGETMNGAEVLVASLEREGVDNFSYPGGASIPASGVDPIENDSHDSSPA